MMMDQALHAQVVTTVAGAALVQALPNALTVRQRVIEQSKSIHVIVILVTMTTGSTKSVRVAITLAIHAVEIQRQLV